MGIVRNLLVRVGADISGLQKALKDAQKTMEKAGKSLSKAGETLTKNITLPVIAAGTALIGMTLNAAKAADDLNDLSSVTGISTDKLQAMSYAGAVLGTDLETMTMAQTRLTRSVFDATKGNKELIQAFETLGVKIYDTNGQLKDADTLFWETIDALKKVEDPIIRDGLAMQLMGKSARELNPLIKAGSDEIKRLMEEGQKFAASKEDIQKLAGLQDEFDKFKFKIGVAATEIAVAFAPVVLQALESISNSIPRVVEVITNLITAFQNLDPGVQKFIIGAAGVVVGLGPVVTVIGRVIGVISTLIGWVGGVVTAFSGLAAGTTSLGGVLMAILGGPAGVIAICIAALVAMALAIKSLWEHNETFRDVVMSVWNNVLVPFGEFLKNTLTAAWNKVSEAAVWLWDNVLTPLGEFLKVFFDNVLMPLGKILFDVLAIAFGTVADVAKSLWTNVLVPLGGFLKEVFMLAVDIVVAVFKELWKDVLVPLGTFLKVTLEPMFKVLGETLTWLWNNILKPVSKFFVDTFKKNLDDVFKTIGSIITRITEAIKEIRKFLGLSDDAAKKTLPNQNLTLSGSLPAFASGGIVTAPTIGLIGEREDEAIIPLSKLKDYAGGGTLVQVILDGRVIQEYIDNGLGSMLAAGQGAI